MVGLSLVIRNSASIAIHGRASMLAPIMPTPRSGPALGRAALDHDAQIAVQRPQQGRPEPAFERQPGDQEQRKREQRHARVEIVCEQA